MLQLSLTTSLEVLNAAIRREPSWIPETHRSLHTQLILEGDCFVTGTAGLVKDPLQPVVKRSPSQVHAVATVVVA